MYLSRVLEQKKSPAMNVLVEEKDLGFNISTDAKALQDGFEWLEVELKEKEFMTYEQCIECLKLYKRAPSKIRSYFPGSICSADVVSQVMTVLEDYGFDDANTLYGQSVCVDEINHEVGDVTNLFTCALGEVFHLGGLAGIPFTGKTGFQAFSHHVPNGGNLFILLAPHMGICKACRLGQYSREGQSEAGSACGAAVGALSVCRNMRKAAAANPPLPPGSAGTADALRSPSNDGLHGVEIAINPFDPQMDFIISAVDQMYDVIDAPENPDMKQFNLVNVMYDVSMKLLKSIIGKNHTQGRIAILGGIQINMPHPMSDFFQPILFEVIEPGASVEQAEDLMRFFPDARRLPFFA